MIFVDQFLVGRRSNFIECLGSISNQWGKQLLELSFCLVDWHPFVFSFPSFLNWYKRVGSNMKATHGCLRGHFYEEFFFPLTISCWSWWRWSSMRCWSWISLFSSIKVWMSNSVLSKVNISYSLFIVKLIRTNNSALLISPSSWEWDFLNLDHFFISSNF